MEIFIKVSQFILSLSILIVLHELGHFIPAKLFKTKVEKFYLFFDYKFSLFKKKIGETVYGIGWIPLGGYVKIAGMIDESMDTEQMKEEPKPWEFRSKPAWQRLIIMLGGVTVNFILGWIILVFIVFKWGGEYIKTDGVKNGYAVSEVFQEYGFANGDKLLKVNGNIPEDLSDINKHLLLRDVNTIEVLHKDGKAEIIQLPENIGSKMWESGVLEPFSQRIFSPVIDSVVKDMSAYKAGLKKGDKIISANGKNIEYWSDFLKAIEASKNKVNVIVKRNENTLNFAIPLDENNKIGISVFTNEDQFDQNLKTEKVNYNFSESLAKGSSLAYWTLKDYIGQFKYVFTKKGATSLGGFISIGKIFPSTWSWKAFWWITAFLSIMLGFMNLLPIPALDGGHVMFTLWEMVTGRKPSDKFLEYAQVTGFIILIALLLFANGNDIYRLITGKG